MLTLSLDKQLSRICFSPKSGIEGNQEILVFFFMVWYLLPRRTSNFVHFIISLAHLHTSPANLLKDSALCKEATEGWGLGVKTEGSIFFIP